MAGAAGRRPGVRAAAATLSLVLLLGACSGSDDGDDAADGSTPSEESTTTTGGEGEADPDGFTVPASRLAEIEAAGLTFAEVVYPAQPDGVPWPTEEWPEGTLDAATEADVQAVVDRAFDELSDDSGTIDAILAVQGGEMVVEEYNDWDPEEPHASWSMAKSITQSLVGIMVREGRIDPFAPAGAPEWADPADPRSEITLDQLLRMSSGLEWEEDYEDPEGDVLTVLDAPDRAAFAAAKPLADEPDTVWEYSTGTSNIVGRAVQQQVPEGQELTEWMDEELFTPLGITGVDQNVDETGNINAGSWVNMRPVDFARFGLLYLRDGEWDGEQILPEGWVDYARMPTPTDPSGEYATHWWLDPEHPGRFYASGFNGQSIMVVPEEDLVVVVLSEVPDDRDVVTRDALLEALIGS